MLIESKIKRTGGSFIQIGGETYHFAPNEAGDHVADVTNDVHVDRLLAIPEGFRLYRGEHAPLAAAATQSAPKHVTQPATQPAASTDVLLGSSVHDDSYNIGSNTYALSDVVAMAHKASGMTVEEWNAMDEEDRHARIDMMLDDLAEQQDTNGDGEVNRADLLLQYEQKFGKKAASNISTATLIKKLAE